MRLPASIGKPKLPAGQGSIWTLSKSSIPRLCIAARQYGSARTASIARMDSSNRSDGLTSSSSSHDTHLTWRRSRRRLRRGCSRDR